MCVENYPVGLENHSLVCGILLQCVEYSSSVWNTTDNKYLNNKLKIWDTD